jgi:hypothetical protein
MLLLTGPCDRSSQARFEPAWALFQTSDFSDLIKFATIESGAGMDRGGDGKKSARRDQSPQTQTAARRLFVKALSRRGF